MGTLPAMAYAGILKQRTGSRRAGSPACAAAGATGQAAFVLRMLQDQHRRRGKKAWACFKQANGSVRWICCTRSCSWQPAAGQRATS